MFLILIPSKIAPTGLNNEFFARACHEWRERLSEGEFTSENQQRLRAEAEREKNRLDPWKVCLYLLFLTTKHISRT